MRILTTLSLCALMAGCGIVYDSAGVREGVTRGGDKVQVVDLTAESVLAANRSGYDPKAMPAVFTQSQSLSAMPSPAYRAEARPGQQETRLPPVPADEPYTIGIGDQLILATPQAATTVEELTGLLASQNRRQDYTVQDDGAIAIPDVGRVRLAGLTLEEAEAVVFRRLVEAQIDPSFSLEIAAFNSKHVSIGGSVTTPTVVPITLVPLYLDQAITAAGGISALDRDSALLRIYRDGALYQIPAKEFYARPALQKTRLIDGDAVFVDTGYDLEKAQQYFSEQLSLSTLQLSARQNAITELNTRVELDAIDRDYVYMTGEVKKQGRFPLPFDRRASLADALYGGADGVATATGNPGQIYVLRQSQDPREIGAVTAWRLDGRNAANMLLATRFELRPNDVVFIAEQPVTRWNRVINQITPSVITLSAQTVN